MSDFFTRLAERTLGLAPTIQPITHSLFAPEPDLPGGMLLEISEESEESEESVVADNFRGNAESPALARNGATHLTDPTSPTQLTRAASMPVQHEVSQRFSTTAPANARRQSPSELVSSTERQARHQTDSLTTYRETLATGVNVQPTRRGSQRTQTVTPAPSTFAQTPSIAQVDAQTLRMARQTDGITETIATFPASSVTDDPFTHIMHSSTAQATSEQQVAQAQQTTRAAMPQEQIVSHHTLVGVPAPNPPSTTGFSQTQQIQHIQQTQLTHQRQQMQQTQQPQLETTSPEPDIQVTIGRVEVRAMTTPPTSARTQQQSDRPPTMSLDEYLRQQERGGGRR